MIVPIRLCRHPSHRYTVTGQFWSVIRLPIDRDLGRPSSAYYAIGRVVLFSQQVGGSHFRGGLVPVQIANMGIGGQG